MRIKRHQIEEANHNYLSFHQKEFEFVADRLEARGADAEEVVTKIQRFQLSIPTWTLAPEGTRYGRFPMGGEPRDLQEKITDIGLMHMLCRSCGRLSLQMPHDWLKDQKGVKALIGELGLSLDAIHSTTFMDLPHQSHSYKYGSLSHTNPAIRWQSIEHHLQSIEYGDALGCRALSVWLADGTNFPGQQDFRNMYERARESFHEIYQHLPPRWSMLIEYKPFEPNFYSSAIPDWGTAFTIANDLGKQALCLVDLGHHDSRTNIEQIVASLMWRHKLGGFHFNDSKYAHDDLTAGSINPMQLFLIFNELVSGMEAELAIAPSYMIHTSNYVKDPMEDLLQSIDALKIAYAQALVVDRPSLEYAQENNDVTMAQEILHEAFRMDVRPLVVEARIRMGGAISPIEAYRSLGVREKLLIDRKAKTLATGL